VPRSSTVIALEQASARCSIQSGGIFRVDRYGIDRGSFRPDIGYRNRFGLTSGQPSNREAQRYYCNRLRQSRHWFVVPLGFEFSVTPTRKSTTFGRPLSKCM